MPHEPGAKLATDAGRTWSREFVLRGRGGGRDVGYSRSIERPDGKVVTIYYFHDQPTSDRYIEAAIWVPRQLID